LEKGHKGNPKLHYKLWQKWLGTGSENNCAYLSFITSIIFYDLLNDSRYQSRGIGG
jgi:hypothetical protein